MKRYIFILLIIFSFPSLSYGYEWGQNWTKTDTALEAAYVGLTIVDWGQTRNLVHEKGYSEINPILGKHPSIDEVDTLIPAGIIAHGIISLALPPQYRRYWQLIFIGIEGFTVLSNYNIGLRIDF